MSPTFLILIVTGVILLILVFTVKLFRILFLLGLIGAIVYFVAVSGSFNQLKDKLRVTDSSTAINRSSCTSSDYRNSTTTGSYSGRENYENIDNVTNEAMHELKNIGDPFLGRGKTEKITRIATDENRTPEQAAMDVVKEVPTGLPKPIDNYVKKTAINILKSTTK